VPDIIHVDLALIDDEFRSGIQVVVDSDGTIERVGPPDATPTVRLGGEALLPGLINVHSHAFQRALRGKTERFAGAEGTFWSWRNQMYALAAQLDAADLRRVCVAAFREMLSRGITTVGEFHYLHHDAGCEGYAFDEVVLNAAAEAGIRIVLLNTYYATGSIGQPLAGAQRRFGSNDLDTFLAQCDRLRGRLNGQTQQLALAAHSIRAVPIHDVVALARQAEQAGCVLHMHVEEQLREIDECRQAYGASPLELLLDRADLGPFFTAVHCTHSTPHALAEFAEAGGNVCLCPITEAHLADGVADVRSLQSEDGAICLGSDSNVRVDLFEEMRWLEYAQRLRLQSRGILRDGAGAVAPCLWRSATRYGARALGVNAGTISAGRLADFFTVDLAHPSLCDAAPDELLETLVFSSDAGAIRRVCVGGKWVVGPDAGRDRQT